MKNSQLFPSVTTEDVIRASTSCRTHILPGTHSKKHGFVSENSMPLQLNFPPKKSSSSQHEKIKASEPGASAVKVSSSWRNAA